MDKATVIAALQAAVRSDLDALTRMVAAARDEATSSESKAENKYDTRATEASYLAAGQGKRLAELQALSGWLDQLDAARPHSACGLGALVHLMRDDSEAWILLSPHGGHQARVEGQMVQLVSASAPLGRVLGGLGAGDGEEVDTPRGRQVLEIVAVS
jgi:transcription elongation GreA/GreB family factor